MDPVRFGILGFGRHAEKVLSAFSRSKFARVIALGTSAPAKCEKLREKSSALTYHSYDKLHEVSELEAIYVCLPNDLHAAWILEGLAKHKHVLTEKPLGIDLKDYERLLSAKSAFGTFFRTGFMYRFHPQHALVKELLSAGEIGTPEAFEACFQYTLEDRNNIRLQKARGGGGLLDVGCYLFDCAEFLFGKTPVSITGSWKINPETNVDEQAEFSLEYLGGLKAKFLCGTNSPRAHYYRINGSTGSILVPQAFHLEPNQKTNVELIKNGAKKIIPIPGVDQIALQVDSFAQLIRGAQTQDLLPDGLSNLRLLLSAQEACTSGKTISIRENF